MKKRKTIIKKTDPLFDGHPEKPISGMTPKEKLDYIWLLMVFKWKMKNRNFINKKN